MTPRPWNDLDPVTPEELGELRKAMEWWGYTSEFSMQEAMRNVLRKPLSRLEDMRQGEFRKMISLYKG